MTTHVDPIDSAATVLETCADSLLTAAAHHMILMGLEPTLDGARHIAVLAMDNVIVRTEIEGAKPG